MSKDKKDVMKEMLGCGCCVDYRKILQGRITELEETIKALRQQAEIDFRVKKDLEEKLDKATADYRALWVKNDELKGRVEHCKDTNAVLCQRNDELRERLENTNESLKRNIQEKGNLQNTVNYLEGYKQHQAKEIERLREIVNASNGSCSYYAHQGMQSKIAKQANEIKRLTEKLSVATDLLHKHHSDLAELYSVIANKDAAINELADRNKALRDALDQASKDAENNFERGKVKDTEELWAAMRDTLKASPVKFAEIYGYSSIGSLLACVTPTWFMNKYHEYKEKEAHDVKIGDEVIMISPYGSDDSEYGIVYDIKQLHDDHKTILYHAIGAGKCFTFRDEDIADGSVRKTGDYFEHIPFDYIS